MAGTSISDAKSSKVFDVFMADKRLLKNTSSAADLSNPRPACGRLVPISRE